MRLLGCFNAFVFLFWQVKWMAWFFVGEITDDDCGLEWLTVIIEETLTIGFYIGMFYLFRPREQNEYFVVEDEETALATMHREFADY
ncbi:hypothetical protein RHGRI_012988 [Rhododendron griersonianum]|uniref:Uncharacterized protein n=1 Tax=Rhododendron griersonianum TaxID=479676 RepID=A0AAV6K432_9ERIC|nr:hypothetical protein RHGRI_012988 [Rhododendron griersonianum]